MNFDEKTCWTGGVAVGGLYILLGILQLLACFGHAFGVGLVQTLALGVSGVTLLLFAACGKDPRARKMPLLAALFLVLGQLFAPLGFFTWPCFAAARRAQDQNTAASTTGRCIMGLGVLQCVAYFIPFSYLAAVLSVAAGAALLAYCVTNSRNVA